jgi:hypothetical protein
MDPISLILGIGGKVLDKIFPDPNQKAEAIAKLEQLKQSGELAQMANELQEQQIALDDRKSAREREIAVKDKMPATLSTLVTFGFFGVLGWLLMHGAPEKGGEALFIMLGSLGTAWIQVMSYYFGSSQGSAKKDVLLAGKQ